MHEYLEKRYALALYEAAEEKGKTVEYLKDLRTIVELINGNEDFVSLIKHPEISSSKKKDIFENMFKGKIEDELLDFLFILINKGRILTLDEKLKEYEKIHLERNNQLLAEVKTVVLLNDEERAGLIKSLEMKYNKAILLTEEIDESLLGGVYLRIGNDVIDGSVRNKLMEMKSLMLKQE